MDMKYIDETIADIDKKILKLNEFKKITKKIPYAEFEKIAELIAERQILINEIDIISDSIKQRIQSQTDDVKEIMNSIISFKEVKADKSFDALKNRVKELENLLISISADEKMASDYMHTIKKKLEEEMQKSNQSKKIIDYFKNNTPLNNNGSKFNSLS